MRESTKPPIYDKKTNKNEIKVVCLKIRKSGYGGLEDEEYRKNAT